MIVTPTKPSSLEAKVPAERKDDYERVSPPPLMLVVTVANNGELRLNTESLGATVADPEPLTERLQMVFAEREANRVYSQNSDAGNPTIEKTVFIKAPTALDYGSVAKVVDTVKLSGANPIGLQLDDLDP
jgi:biopolymer transport protein ExbD